MRHLSANIYRFIHTKSLGSLAADSADDHGPQRPSLGVGHVLGPSWRNNVSAPGSPGATDAGTNGQPSGDGIGDGMQSTGDNPCQSPAKEVARNRV